MPNTPLFTNDYYNIDGYRDNAQIRWFSPFNKISFPLLGGILSLRYNYFNADWGAPGYWPIDWVKGGLVDRKRAYNVTDGGYMGRYEAVANYAPACGERGLYATLYCEGYHPMRFAAICPSPAVSMVARMTGYTGAAKCTTIWSSVM